MEDIKLIEMQKKLDEKKYLESEIANQDLGGLMDFCKNCVFQKMESNAGRIICNLNRKAIEANYVCAKNYFRNKENEIRRRTKNSEAC